jgi:hypothetical protein
MAQKIRDLEINKKRSELIHSIYVWDRSIKLFLILLFSYLTYDISSDRSIIKTIVPYSVELDAPILLKNLKESSKIVKSNYLKGYVRSVMKCLFPRNEQDAKLFMDKCFVYFDSSGPIKREIGRRIGAMEAYLESVKGGYFYRFYESKTSGGWKINYFTDEDKWVATIESFLVKHDGSSKVEYRYNPTIYIEFESDDETIENPYGLLITKFEMRQITDYVTGDYKLLEY